MKVLDSIKTELTKPTVFTLYELPASSNVCAEASFYGLSGVLMQENKSQCKTVPYVSKSLPEMERYYVQNEKEALATTWACESL